MLKTDELIHMTAGGIAGTAGAIVTSPLEVVKTRLQSSSSHFHPPRMGDVNRINNRNVHTKPTTQLRDFCSSILRKRSQILTISHCGISSTAQRISIWQCIKYIVKTEGTRGLFKGLGPNIIGVAPSRGLYFWVYTKTKKSLNQTQIPSDSHIVHIFSALCAGFVSTTATSPIWVIKTRLQLDQNTRHRLTAWRCMGRIYRTSGVFGFYKGITASYVGISETVIHFVIYEAIKKKIADIRQTQPNDGRSIRDFFEFMLAGAVSKSIATFIAYPHEVARTRLREEGNKYRTCWQTLVTVWREEGKAGLYRGLATHFVRQIPNTAIIMSTYEAFVYILSRHFNTEFYDTN